MDLNILWFVPIAYFIHIMEESPRFVPWAKRYLGAPSTFAQFVLGNVVFMVYVLVSVSVAVFYPSEWTLVLGLATAAWIFSNFLIHASFTLYTGEYSPGVVTASAIYAPGAVYIYATFLGSGVLSPIGVIASIVIGFAVMYVPTLIQERRLKPDRRQLTARRSDHEL